MSLSMKTVGAVVLCICASAGSVFGGQSQLYWANTSAGTIQRANLDGSDVADVITGLAEPFALAADLPAGKLYWSERTTGRIRCSGLDGSDPRDFATGTGDVVDMAIDSANGFIYWSELNGPVQRVKTDGSALEALPLPAIYPEALLLEGNNLYIGSNLAPSIIVCNLFNFDVTTIVESGFGGPWAFAHDPVTGFFYCVDEDDNQIVRWEACGDVEWNYVDLLEGGRLDSYPGGAALDPVGRMFYWTDYNDDAIYCFELGADSGERHMIDVLHVQGDPGRIILVPEPHATALVLAAAGLLMRRRRLA